MERPQCSYLDNGETGQTGSGRSSNSPRACLPRNPCASGGIRTTACS